MDKYENFNPDITYGSDGTYAGTETSLSPAEPGTDTSKTGRRKKREKADRSKKQTPEKKKPVMTTESGVISRIKTLMTKTNMKLVVGMCAAALGIWMLVAFTSYIVHCVSDQALVNNSPLGSLPPVGNQAGEGGARISEFLINEGFGVGSLVIVLWLLAMSGKLLIGWPKFKSVNFTIKCLVAIITLSLIVGLTTIAASTPVNWGGFHGRYVNEFIVGFVGWSGAALLCLLMACLFVLICMRDVINWILRLKRQRDEQRRLRREELEEQMRREAELEAMRQREATDAAASGEGADTLYALQEKNIEEVVSFAESDDRDSYSLPDIDEYYPRNEYAGQSVPHEEETNWSEDMSPDVEGDDESKGDEQENNEEGQPENRERHKEMGPMVVNVNTVQEANRLEASASPSERSLYKFPPLELLNPGKNRVEIDPEELAENKEHIRKILLDFNIPITSIEATVGPTVTLYEIRPERGVKISKIRSLTDDIALRLSAKGVRIIAPIPGKGTVGIEVANKEPQTVSMRTLINSRKYQTSKAKLPVAIGSTISNEVFITDLTKMPHLLVAGATGQGKSVGLNAIIASLLYCKKPHELKLVMIDPKQVEFSLYAKLEKHYLAKLPNAEDAIITDMNRVVDTLKSLCVEMDNRYMLLKELEVRNLEEYNAKVARGNFTSTRDHHFLPYIVLVIDEFADLIMTSGKEVETPIARLAQKARAIGIHVIIATQRPSTNVITGIIKANFPARIAFKVSSGVDSKTILDTPGAQLLIGRGDMLISNNSEMVRVQCAFIDTPEVEAICAHIASQPGFEGAYILPEPPASSDGSSSMSDNDNGGPVDPLFEECARFVVTSNVASTSGLQRRYSIGYNRAGKIMDQLEAAGIVGPSTGGKPRTVLTDSVGLEAILEQYVR